MLGHHFMHNYVLIKKSSLLFAGLAAAGLVGYHFYRHHHAALKKDVEQLADDVAGAAKAGTQKVKEVVKEAKA